MKLKLKLPAGLENPADVRDRLTRLAQRQMAQVCGSVLASLPGDHEAVYRIRGLRLDLWLDQLGMSETEVAQRWGQLLAKSTMHVMQRGEPQQVMRFDSPRHFIAAFLRDVLDGRAWSRWYYAEFRHLQQLSIAAIALELLVSRPDWIAPVLTDLAASDHTTRLIEQWTADDINRLWTVLGYTTHPIFRLQDPGNTRRLATLAALWSQAALSCAPDRTSRARDRLRLWLALVAAHPGQTRELEFVSLIHTLVDLAALLRTEADLASLLLMETGLYPAALRRIGAGDLADTVGWLATLSATAQGRAYLARMAEVFNAKSGQRAVSAALTSPVGSVFLLGPALSETGLWELWHDELGEDVARRYLFIVALKALGHERAPLFLGDAMPAAFAGLREPPTADARLPTEADSPPGVWASTLPEIAARWYPAQDRDLTVSTTHGVYLLRDAAVAIWLATSPTHAHEPEPDPAVCWPDLAIDFSTVRYNLTKEEQARLAAEAEHLQLGPRLGYPWLTPSLDAALSAAASLVLRRTAARLPGFAQASPSYLARQFLAQPATLISGPEALTVRLSGGPLAVVLRLAALPEEIHIPWLPQPLRLKLPGALE